MNFAPFSFLSQQGGVFTPNSISDLTFWLDFSDSSMMTLSGSLITSLTSSIVSSSVTIKHELTRVNVDNYYYKLTSSLSQPSLNSGYVTNYPTAYRDSSWSTADNNAIVQGAKTDTTSYPDGMTFMVLNREYENQLGYFVTRYNGSTDRGTFFSENRTGGSYPPTTPQLTIGNYDQNSGITYFSGSNNTANLILTRENNSATRTIWRGSTQTATDSGNDQQSRTFRQFHNLGRYASSTTQTEATPIKTYYCEVIQYNRVLTSDERTQVWNYLSNKWNVSL